MKTLFLYILKLCAVFCVCVLAAFVLIEAVYSLPCEAACANLSASAYIFEAEDVYTPSLFGLPFSVLDNSTDALMLAEAAYDGEAPEDAMLNPYYLIPELNTVNSLLCIYPGGEIERAVVNNYSRYWHGYLVFLKPLLMLTDYGGIRAVMTLAQLGLVLLVMLLLFKRRHTRFILPVLFLYLFLCPMALRKSLQYNTVFMLCYLQLLLVLLFPRLYADRRVWPVHFLIAGCSVGYLDFLTYPLLSFGVPLLFMLSVSPERPVKDLCSSVKAFIAWGCGYFGIMSSKWLIASLITRTDVVSDALNSLLVRSSGVPEQLSGETALRLSAIFKNLTVARHPLSVFLALAAIYLVCCLLSLTGSIRTRTGSLRLPRTSLPPIEGRQPVCSASPCSETVCGFGYLRPERSGFSCQAKSNYAGGLAPVKEFDEAWRGRTPAQACSGTHRQAKQRGVEHRSRTSVGRLGIYAAFAAAPFLWYIILANHSYYHSFFTFRNLGLSVFALWMLCAELTPQKNIKAPE